MPSCLTVPWQCPDTVGLCLGVMAEDCSRRGRAHPAGGRSGVVGMPAMLMQGCAGRSWLGLVSSCVQAFRSALPQDLRVCVFYPSPSLPQTYFWFRPTLWPLLSEVAPGQSQFSCTHPPWHCPVPRAGRCVARQVLPCPALGMAIPLPAQPGSPVGLGSPVAG